MENPLTSDEGRWNLVVGVSTVAAGLAVRSLMKAGWRRFHGDEPPTNPADPDIEWRDALVWAGASAAAVAVSRVLARRAAAGGWRRVTGNFPPI